MAVKIVTAEGLEYIFNPSFRVSGIPLSKNVPSIAIGGRDGEVVHTDAIRLTPRNIAVTGHIYGSSPADADAALDQMLEVISGGELKLYKDELDSKFLKVRFSGNAHSYISGTNRVVAACNLSFTAHDPYFYEETQKVEKNISVSPTSWSVYCRGNVEWQQPVIWIKAKASALQWVSISNMTAGTEPLNWHGTIAVGRSLVLNCERRLAYITNGTLDYYLAKWGMGSCYGAVPALEEQVTANMDTSWLVHGWPLMVGANNFLYSDEAASSHNADIVIANMPRYY